MQVICEMVGATFRPQSARDTIRGLVVGDVLTLERDSGNPYDNFAVKVMLNDEHLGFIPKTDNWEIASYFDADESNTLTATILSFNNTLKPMLLIELPDFA